MKIIGIEGMSPRDLEFELQQGSKFVMYTYCISILIMTFRRSSDIYFVKYNENAVNKGMKFTLLSVLLGWWGIPWGPIYTIGALVTNFRGGKDVTQAVIQTLNSQVA